MAERRALHDAHLALDLTASPPRRRARRPRRCEERTSGRRAPAAREGREGRLRVLAPARRRELGLADGAIAVRDDPSMRRHSRVRPRESRRGSSASQQRLAGGRLLEHNIGDAGQRDGRACATSNRRAPCRRHLRSNRRRAACSRIGSTHRESSARNATNDPSALDAQLNMTEPVRSRNRCSSRMVVATPSSVRMPRSSASNAARAQVGVALVRGELGVEAGLLAHHPGRGERQSREEPLGRHVLDLRVQQADGLAAAELEQGRTIEPRHRGRGTPHEGGEVQVEPALHVRRVWSRAGQSPPSEAEKRGGIRARRSSRPPTR